MAALVAGTLIGGAALGAAFQLLSTEIQNTIQLACAFKGDLENLAKKLEFLVPITKKIKETNMELDLSLLNITNFEAEMNNGMLLVAKCKSLSSWKKAYKRPGHTKKLRKFDKYLDELRKILGLQLGVDNLAISGSMKSTVERFEKQENMAPVHLANQELLREIHSATVTSQGQGLQESRFVKGCCEVPEPPEFTVGLDKPLEELKMVLLGEDSSVLVLTAPPGYGKTTIVKKLCSDDKIKEEFPNIMFVKVSKTADLKLIVQSLYEHNGVAGPVLRDDEDATDRLKKLLKKIGQKSPMLLVLDDVWSGSESLVKKFILPIPKYKILVISRSEFKGFGSLHELKSLSNEDAMALFHNAIVEDGNSNIPSEDVVKKVVEHCKNVPLALELIGTFLRGKSQVIWEQKVEEWSGDSSLLNSEKALFACLKSSLDFLEEKDVKLKECFLDLAAFPEDKRIPATALIDIWTELHGLRELHAAANLFELNHLNMANLVVTRRDAYENDGYYSEHFVTQHDMLRELAIHQSGQEKPEEQRKRLILELNGNNLPDWWNQPNKPTFNARLVSITTDGKFSSKWCNMNLPEAEVLILNFQSENYALPDFLKTMNKLKVLIITNHGFFPAELTNFELLGSLTNLKRIRFERVVIPSLNETSIVLKNLQKISFFLCQVAQAFDSMKTSEVFPSLEEFKIDYCTDLVKLPTEFCDTVNEKLKKLSITHCHKLSELPEEIGNLVNLELLRLRSCIGLENLPDSICKLYGLMFLDISDCFSIRYLPEDIGEMRGLTKINMEGCSRLGEIPPSVLDMEELKEVVCDEDLKELWEACFAEAEINLRSEEEKKITLKLAKEDYHLRWLQNLD